ncbi:MAG TPA: cell wall-binding repeat-containing protein [Coriobacteriia bacterium]
MSRIRVRAVVAATLTAVLLFVAVPAVGALPWPPLAYHENLSNDTFATASGVTIASNQSGDGAVSPVGDVDFWEIPAVANTWYEVWIRGSGGFDPYATLYTGDGTPPFLWMDDQAAFKFDSESVSDVRFTFYARASTKHFLKVETKRAGTTGTYGIRVYAVTPVPQAPLNMRERIGGADRYEVAKNITEFSFQGWLGIEHVVIASGTDRALADPLTASGLAGAYDAPLLLVRADWPGRLPGPTASAIALMKQHNPSKKLKFHIVGGPASVPESLVKVLKSYAPPGSTVDRIGGADRYEVAANVADRMRKVLGPDYPKTAFITNGQLTESWPDALACGPVAYRNHFPILLVKLGSVPAVTETARKQYTTRYAVGSAYAISDALVTKLDARRIAGASRAEVARALVERSYFADPQWMGRLNHGGVDNIMVTNKLSDALAASVLGGRHNMGLLYTGINAGNLPDEDTGEVLMRNAGDGFCVVYAIGGPASVPEATLVQIGRRMGFD